MKIYILIPFFMLFSACVSVRPGGVGYDKGKTKLSKGKACLTSWFHFFSQGEASLNAAKKAGNLSRIAYYDIEVYSVLGFYMESCVIAYGEKNTSTIEKTTIENTQNKRKSNIRIPASVQKKNIISSIEENQKEEAQEANAEEADTEENIEPTKQKAKKRNMKSRKTASTKEARKKEPTKKKAKKSSKKIKPTSRKSRKTASTEEAKEAQKKETTKQKVKSNKKRRRPASTQKKKKRSKTESFDDFGDFMF